MKGIRRLWASVRDSWPMWLFFVTVVALWGAWERGADSVEHNPAPVVTVYVPAGPDVCATESDCGTDWDGQRWIIVPGETE